MSVSQSMSHIHHELKLQSNVSEQAVLKHLAPDTRYTGQDRSTRLLSCAVIDLHRAVPRLHRVPCTEKAPRVNTPLRLHRVHCRVQKIHGSSRLSRKLSSFGAIGHVKVFVKQYYKCILAMGVTRNMPHGS